MSRLVELLEDLGTMPGVVSACLFAPEGLLATTSEGDAIDDDRIGHLYANLVHGAFTLGQYVQDLYCDFDNAVIMARPVGRGCILIARCQPGVSIRLVEISLTMTAKSIEAEIASLHRLPAPIRTGAAAREPVREAIEESAFFRDMEDQPRDDNVDEVPERELTNVDTVVDEFASDAK